MRAKMARIFLLLFTIINPALAILRHPPPPFGRPKQFKTLDRTVEEMATLELKLRQLNDVVKAELELAPKPPETIILAKPTYVEPPVGSQKTLTELNDGINNYMYQADVLLTQDQIDEMLSGSSTGRRKRKVTSSYTLWPNPANIPYQFATTDPLAPGDQTTVRNVMAAYEQNTCLRFTESSSADAITIFAGSGCWSYIGYTAGSPAQSISLDDGCVWPGIVGHEFGHALGLLHEQSRTDRDGYVTINIENIDSGKEGNFGKAATKDRITYEYGSGMHYAATTFSSNDLPCIVALDPQHQRTMGQAMQMTFLDYKTINTEYCTSSCDGATNDCQNDGYPNPNNCAECLCPDSFTGTKCESLQLSEIQSCGSELAATTDWQSLTSTVGTWDGTDGTSKCYWHIISPEATNIEVRVTSISNDLCTDGCFWGALEIKPTNFDHTGYSHCCDSDNINYTYTGGSLVPVIARGYYSITFTFEYRYVGTQDTTAVTDVTASTSAVITTAAEPITDGESTTALTTPTTTAESTVAELTTLTTGEEPNTAITVAETTTTGPTTTAPTAAELTTTEPTTATIGEEPTTAETTAAESTTAEMATLTTGEEPTTTVEPTTTGPTIGGEQTSAAPTTVEPTTAEPLTSTMGGEQTSAPPATAEPTTAELTTSTIGGEQTSAAPATTTSPMTAESTTTNQVSTMSTSIHGPRVRPPQECVRRFSPRLCRKCYEQCDMVNRCSGRPTGRIRPRRHIGTNDSDGSSEEDEGYSSQELGARDDRYGRFQCTECDKICPTLH